MRKKKNGQKSENKEENEIVNNDGGAAEENEKSSRALDILSGVGTFIYSFIVTVFVALAIIFLVCKATDITAFSVQSGSMEPKYPTGSAVFVKEVKPETVKTGDVITFVINEQGMLATHRVVSVDKEAKTFRTKGDANAQPDPSPVLWGNLVGRVMFCVPKMGAIIDVFSNEDNRPYIITIAAVVIALSVGSDIFQKKRSSRRKSDEE